MQGDQVVPFLDQSIVVKMEVRWPQTQFMNPIPVYKNLYVIIISCGVVVVADILNMQSGNFWYSLPRPLFKQFRDGWVYLPISGMGAGIEFLKEMHFLIKTIPIF